MRASNEAEDIPELLIGRVIKTHGIRGEVVLDPTTDYVAERFFPGAVHEARLGSTVRSLTIATLRPHKGRLLVKFAEIADRTEAETLRGAQFFGAPMTDPSDIESFYDHELVGLRVLHNGVQIGQVSGRVRGVAQDMLEIVLSDSGREVVVPFVHAIVPDVDVEAGTVTLTPPDGLLEL